MTFPAAITVPRSQVVIDFITALGWDVSQETGYPLLPGPEILLEPDKAVFVTMTGGPGYATEEGGVDNWSFQARVRGASDDPYGPEVAAQELDWLLLTAPVPSSADGVHVRMVTRMGSPPAPLPLDPADRRFEYTANYIVSIGV